MSGFISWGELGQAVGAAAQATYKEWRQSVPAETDSETLFAVYCESIEVRVHLRPGVPVAIVCEVIDRRPGKSALEHYVVERKPKHRKMWRRK